MSDDEEKPLRIDESDDDDPQEVSPRPPPTIKMPSLPLPTISSSLASGNDPSGKEEGELDEDDDEDEEEEEEEGDEQEGEAMDTDDEEPKLVIDEDEPVKSQKAPEPQKHPEKEKQVKLEKKEEPVTSEPSSPAHSSRILNDSEIKDEDLSEETPMKQEPGASLDVPSASRDKRESKSPTPSKKENGLMKPPQSTEKPQRKRKESTDSFSNDKRKSGLETVASSSGASSSNSLSTPQRSKRSSSHMATIAISACFTEEDIVSVPMMPIGRTPDTGTQPKRAKRDYSTNVITTRGTDTSGLVCNETIMETPPGSQLTLEVTVMYRTKNSMAFRVKGCDLIGFIGDGLPPMASSLANNSSSSGANNNKKKSNQSNNEEGKDGRSSSASSNGRTARGGSVVKDGKSDKQKGKKKKEEANDDELDDENQSNDQFGSKRYELQEIDVSQLHDCHYENCEKRFQKSTELEYHIAKNHKKRVMVYESICTQTDISSLKTQDAETEIDDDLPPMPQMPVLKKEVPIKGSVGPVYEDLSDDDNEMKPTDLALKSSSSAAAALMGIVQASSSNSGAPSLVPRTAPATPVSAKIGINPSMVVQAHNAMVEKNKQQQQQQQQQQRNAFVPNSPRPNQPSTSSHLPSSSAVTSSPAQPPGLIQAHPMATHFLPPGFHPGLLHHPQMAALAMDPRILQMSQQQQVQQQQQQQMSRTPSRQTMATNDSHKIHELAKSKENEQRQKQQATTPKTPAGNAVAGGGAVTPQRQFIPPQMQVMQVPPGTPQSVQQQQQQQAAVAAQQQHQLMQQMQMQMQRGGLVTQPELMMMMMGMGMPIPGAAPGVPQGFPGQPPQQQPK